MTTVDPAHTFSREKASTNGHPETVDHDEQDDDYIGSVSQYYLNREPQLETSPPVKSGAKAKPSTNGQPPPAKPPPEILTLDELVDSDEPPYDWIVPGLFERGDRVILTGLEGKGKSTLWRQVGVQLAAGIHPFGGDPFDPLNVLIVDCENSKRQVRRKAGPLRDSAGRGARLKFVFRPDGIRLDVLEAECWLEDIIQTVQPDVGIIGPVYKMAGGDPKDERAAKATSDVLDRLRITYGFTLLLEAHTPYAESSKSKRPERPYGASLWSRWPEFGIYLADDGKLSNWRGPRDEREWPAKLKRGENWPWEVDGEATTSGDEWHGPTECMERVVDLLVATTPTEYSSNQLVTAMLAHGYKFHRKTIFQAAEILATERRINVRSGTRNSRIYCWTLTLPGVDDDVF